MRIRIRRLLSNASSYDPLPVDNPLRALERRRMRRSHWYWLFGFMQFAAAALVIAFAFFCWHFAIRVMSRLPPVSNSRPSPTFQLTYTYDAASATTTCHVYGTMIEPIYVRDITTASAHTSNAIPARLVLCNPRMSQWYAVYLEKEVCANSLQSPWRIVEVAGMDGQFICWKGADLRLPDWRRREIAVLLEQETIATILAYNLFPPGKVDQVAAFFPPKQSEIYAEFRDPFSPPKWTVLDMRVTDSSSLADRRWDFEKGYWPTCLPEIMMGRPTGKPSEGGQLPSEIMAMQMKILCLIFLLLWPLYFFMMPLYHAPAILTRMRNLNFEQTRLTLLSDNEIYEGHFARFWACWRRSAILFLLALFAGSLLILASGGIHTRVLWQDFWIDERMPSILRPNVSTIFSVFICAGAPMIAFISLSLCVMRWRQWLLRALVSVAVPAAYFATRALLVVALGPMVKVAQDLPRIRYIHSDTLRSVGMIVVSLIALALWTWLFSRTLRWTRRNFARQDFSS